MSDPNQPKSPHLAFHERRSQLITAVYSSTSAHNGNLIYALLDELRELTDESLTAEFARCEALVQQWKETWYPDMS